MFHLLPSILSPLPKSHYLELLYSPIAGLFRSLVYRGAGSVAFQHSGAPAVDSAATASISP